MNNVLSYNDRMRLLKRQRAIQGSLQGEDPEIPRRFKAHMRDDFRGDPNLLKEELNRIDRTLRNGGVPNLNRREKSALERQAKLDREWLRKNMVPKTYMGNERYKNKHTGVINRQGSDFRKAVQHALKEHSSQFQQRANRYKNSMRTLAPDDPEASNLESIRPK